ncbi:type 1 fimbrial protein [Citrobacter sp. Cs237]|uniref:type 1 fimbrial protein n=1 Tax=Citrobacter TaxID=544 RepID=UPI0025756250|nr:type 1 fimbrial protein [Citrobacter sp. Cs237]MDM2748777.1 type 1 fimbrial protein [Citrobacter sp. Cs237]HBU8848743.1 type 1 fimbrial protein [Citrobacter sedlakii]
MQLSVTVLKTVLTLSLFSLFSLFSAVAIADADHQGGVIRFTGQIVEPPCEVDRVQHRFALSCNRGGQIHTQYYSPQELINAPHHFKQIASVNMQYIDKNKTLAVMNINYR